jgi:hypothetical protein
MRLLILSCSAAKRLDAHALPAIERYDGPAYRLIRKYLRECSAQRQCLDILIVSAEFGLLMGDAAIPFYDRRMDLQRANEVRPLLQQQAASLLADRPVYATTCTNLGELYARAVVWDDITSRCGITRFGTVTHIHGAIGQRLHQLKRWLEAANAP